ncbi:MAG: ATP-binding protein [Thermodesulfobacteriota bacterium]
MKELVIISGKGGTGKTSIVAGLAGVAPELVLADCDVDAADLHLILHPDVEQTTDFYSGETPHIDPDSCTSCGVCAEACRFGAISEDIRIQYEQCEGCALCSYVCPEKAITMHPRLCGQWYISATRFGPMVHASLGIGEENSGKLVTTVRQNAHTLAAERGYEWVLADGSPGIGCPVIASLTNASAVLLVAEPTVSAIHDLKRVSELTRHFQLPTLAVINKTDVNPELVEEIKTFCHSQSIPIVGSLPYDARVTQAQIQGQSISEYDPQGLGRTMHEIWAQITHNV